MATPAARLLILDDEVALMRALCDTLGTQGYETTGFTSAGKALAALRERSFDLLITDLMMPETDGISVLREAFAIDPNVAGIVMTGHASVDTAVKALKSGALDYILKPFKLGAILPVLSRALTLRRLRMENFQLREAVGLHELSMAIAFAEDSKSVLDKVADAAAAQSNARGLSVLLVDEKRRDRTAARQELLVAAVRGAGGEEIQRERYPVSPELISWAEQWAGEAFSEDETSAPAPLEPQLPPGVSIPMLAAGKLTGILHMDLPERRDAVNLGQSRAMRILASTGASALAAVSGMERLRAAEERYRRLAEDAPDIVCRYELYPQPAVTYVNPAILTATGHAPEEYYEDAQLLMKIVHPDDRLIIEQVLRGEHPCGGTVTVRWVGKEGREIWVEQRNNYVRDRHGRLMAVESVSRDVTERKALEDRLRHSERLEAIGKLTAGVAHDFNNLLTIVNGYAELAIRAAEPNSTMWSRLQEIRKAGEQAAAVTAQLLAFSRKQILQPRPVDLKDLLETMDTAIRNTAGAGVDVTVDVQSDLGWAQVDPGQMHQVILNLVVNARDAMGGSGWLALRAGAVDINDSRGGGPGPGKFVRLTISDNGCGMSPEVMRRAFEPFYTTKSVGRGTGLGLASVQGIVEQSGGHIQIQSEVGKGTTFTIWLPRCDRPANSPGLESADIAVGRETILLVEDDPGVRGLAQDILSGAGYQVLSAATMDSAISIAQSFPGKIALLVTDMCLEDSDGPTVAKRVGALRPGIKCLFVSGFMEGLPAPNTPSLPRFKYLQKPYSPAALCEQVRTLLDTRTRIRQILVVDDERPIRNLLQEILEGAGYEVTTAENGREAMKLLRREWPVDLFITDLVMPEMEGIEFITSVRKERPEAKIVATSGGNFTEILRAAAHLGAHATLAKPLTPEQVLDCVRTLSA